MKIYDSLSKKILPVKTKVPGEISIYACGPTVYSHAHIGNFRSFLTADLLVRTALRAGLKVKYVSNITDVGHLTVDDLSDAQGEDKLSKAFVTQHRFLNIQDLARFYTESLIKDWSNLGLIEPMVRPRASEHVAEQLELIQTLIEKGYAYETDQGVYFEVSKFPNYGKLSGNTGDSLLAGVRDIKTDHEKHDPRDFALWKKDQNHLMRWSSKFGWGYPGWHIECSAMAMKYLGKEIDIHTGGVDNKFPHHECEIAQSEAATEQTYVKYWLHTAHLLVEGKKMSKSLGNFLTVRDLLEKRTHPLALRIALIAARYRDHLNFTQQSLDAFSVIEERIRTTRNVLLQHKEITIGHPVKNITQLQESICEIDEAMRNDLNTPVALAAFNSGLKYINSNIKKMSKDEISSSLSWFEETGQALGIVDNADYEAGSSGDLKIFLERLIKMRNSARDTKDFQQADSIRNFLSEAGVELQDGEKGTTWKFTN